MTINQRLPSDHESVCESEPITFPGLIQPFGCLIGVDAQSGMIAYASENVAHCLGLDAAAILGHKLADLFSAESLRRLDELMATERYAPTNFTSVTTQDGARTMDAVVHRTGGYLLVECVHPADPGEAARTISDAQRLIQRIRGAVSLEDMLATTAAEARALTGFDRALVYRFDEDMHGQVVAESREPELEAFLGLHYPATDIPSQARRMYLLQRVRQIPDVDAEPVAILGEPGRSAAALDLTYAVTRSVSPFHIEYLRNMGVRATLTVSIIVDDALWGMLVFHHRTPKEVGCTLRGLCDLIGQTLSVMVDVRAAADRRAVLAARAHAVSAVEEELLATESIATALGSVSQQLLDAMAATGCYVKIGGALMRFGETPPEPMCRTVMSRLSEGEASYAASAELRTLDGTLGDVADIAAGAAAIFLPNHPGDGVIWFRPERRRSVSWGGDPNRPVHIDDAGRLGPRRSFAEWVEIVDGTSERFDTVDGEVAQRLRRGLIGALLRISEERLHWVKNFDALTGLLRREVAESRLRRTAAAVDNGVVGVVIVTINRFSLLAERYGARTGDQVVIGAARRLQALLAKGDYLARFGEESFMLVARRDNPDDLRRLGSSILDAFRRPFEEEGVALPVSVRAGIAHHPGSPIDELVSTALAAEREAAREKRGRWLMLDRPPTRGAPTAADFELEIAPALVKGEFRAVFQPIISLADETVVGVETLCRWRSEAFGDVSPDLFIPAAVEAGQIFPLTTFVLEMALETVAPHIAAGRLSYVSVNADVSLLERRSFAAAILSALHRNALSPKALVLEVTESALSSEMSIATLGELRKQGVRIAIDDFGVGYSSLAYLSRMPIDLVKIDRGFIVNAVADERGRALFASIAQLVDALGFVGVVEGVETDEQRRTAIAFGCPAAQGWYFARALEASDLGPWLVGWNSRS